MLLGSRRAGVIEAEAQHKAELQTAKVRVLQNIIKCIT